MVLSRHEEFIIQCALPWWGQSVLEYAPDEEPLDGQNCPLSAVFSLFNVKMPPRSETEANLTNQGFLFLLLVLLPGFLMAHSSSCFLLQSQIVVFLCRCFVLNSFIAFLKQGCSQFLDSTCITRRFALVPHSIDRRCLAAVTGRAVIALTFDPARTFELCGERPTKPTVGHKHAQSQTFTISVVLERCVICLTEWPWDLRELA